MSNNIKLEDKWKNTRQNAYTKDLATLTLRNSGRGARLGKGKDSLAPINNPPASYQASPYDPINQGAAVQPIN